MHILPTSFGFHHRALVYALYALRSIGDKQNFGKITVRPGAPFTDMD